MKNRFKESHTARARAGEIVLTAARHTDTTSVAAELADFTEKQAAYVAAQAAVDEALATVRQEVRRLSPLNTAQNRGIDKLISALVGDGHPHMRPFGSFGVGSPSALKRAPYRKKPQVIRALTESVITHASTSAATADVARALAAAADAMEEALAPILPLENALGAARMERDSIGDRWGESLAVLKSAARHQALTGEAGLYDRLFRRAAAPSSSRKGRRPVLVADDRAARVVTPAGERAA